MKLRLSWWPLIFLLCAWNSPSWAMDAAFVSQAVPSTLVAGSTQTVTVTFENTGTETWTEATDYRLGSQNPQDNSTWGMTRVNIPDTAFVSPGQIYSFSFSIQAPASPGAYNFQWRMVRDGVGWFGSFSTNVIITVIPPTPTHSPTRTVTRTITPTATRTPTPVPRNSAFISQAVLPSMLTGGTQTVTVTFRNTGSETWTQAALFKLGSQNPQDNLTWRTTNRVLLAAGDSIALGQLKSFSFSIQAPASPGAYNFQWRMVRDNVGWFGEYSPNLVITVLVPTPTATRTASPTRTNTRTRTPTPTFTRTATITPTFTVTKTITVTSTVTLTSTPTASPTCTRTITPGWTATPTSTPTFFVIPDEKVLTYPSPARGKTLWFYYHVNGPAKVRLEIFNVLGERVMLREEEKAAAGYHRTEWDISRTAPGVFLYRMEVETPAGKRDLGLHRLVIAK